MKKVTKKLGLFEFANYVGNNGETIEAGHPEFDAMWKEIREVGFCGLGDFLSKAEKLADDQLSSCGLPTNWPTPAKMKIFGKEVDGWYTPDECEPAALTNASANVQFAARLKADVHSTRQLLGAAEFRHRHQEPENLMREAIYRGVIVSLSYWTLKANVQWERHVLERETRIKKLAGVRPDAKITAAAHAAAMKKSPSNQTHRARLLGVSRQALVKYEKNSAGKK
ncbi:MAG: hypothetical protein QM808_16310 [Steroidobacteraceae bacterium]